MPLASAPYPRIRKSALPPTLKAGRICVWHFAEPLDSAADVELHEQVKRDNQRDPQQSDDNRPAIQVLLSDTGGACILRQTTAEHIGQAAPLTLVHEDKQRQQEAEDDKKNLDNQLKNSQT